MEASIRARAAAVRRWVVLLAGGGGGCVWWWGGGGGGGRRCESRRGWLELGGGVTPAPRPPPCAHLCLFVAVAPVVVIPPAARPHPGYEGGDGRDQEGQAHQDEAHRADHCGAEKRKRKQVFFLWRGERVVFFFSRARFIFFLSPGQSHAGPPRPARPARPRRTRTCPSSTRPTIRVRGGPESGERERERTDADADAHCAAPRAPLPLQPHHFLSRLLTPPTARPAAPSSWPPPPPRPRGHLPPLLLHRPR